MKSVILLVLIFINTSLVMAVPETSKVMRLLEGRHWELREGPFKRLGEGADQRLREIADNTAAVSVAYNRNLLWKMAGADHPMEAHKLDSRGMRALGAMADAKEGVASFLEKRAPRFSDSAATQMPDYYPWWRQRVFE